MIASLNLFLHCIPALITLAALVAMVRVNASMIVQFFQANGLPEIISHHTKSQGIAPEQY